MDFAGPFAYACLEIRLLALAVEPHPFLELGGERRLGLIRGKPGLSAAQGAGHGGGGRDHVHAFAAHQVLHLDQGGEERFRFLLEHAGPEVPVAFGLGALHQRLDAVGGRKRLAERKEGAVRRQAQMGHELFVADLDPFDVRRGAGVGERVQDQPDRRFAVPRFFAGDEAHQLPGESVEGLDLAIVLDGDGLGRVGRL